jgi:serine/threonine protein kinase
MEIAKLAAAAVARIGDRLADQWRLEQLDRVDLVAAAYTAVDQDGKHYTVRIVHEELAQVEDLVQPFAAVERLAGAIPHADVTRFVDQGRIESGSPFVVLGHTAGESLAELVARRPGRVPPAEALRIVIDVLSMLMAAHAEGLVHGSIRPDQVLLTETGAVRLAGFGSRPLQLAAMRHFGLHPSPEMAAFTPPELARNPEARVTGSCDVWGATALLFHLLTGETVHRESSVEEQLAALAAQPPRPLRELAQHVPPRLEFVARRGLALSPRERFASARSMRAALSQVMELPEVTALRGLKSAPVGPPSSHDVPPSQRPTPGRVEGVSGETRANDRPLSAPPPNARPVPLPRTPAPLADRRATASYELVDGKNVVVAPGKISPNTSNPTARAITLPALPSIDVGPESAPHSSRDGAIARYLGRAWAARSVGDDVWAWILRLVEITQARMTVAVVPMTIHVLPWGLREGDTDTWEADVGLIPIIHRLYGGGLRSLVIERPLDSNEATTLVDLPFLLGDPDAGSDMRCALWSTRLGGLHLTLDDGIEMRGNQRRFAEEQREVLALAHFDTSFQLEDCWQSAERRRPKEAAGVWRGAHQGALGVLYSVGLTPEGLRDDFQARLTSQLEAEASPEPARVEFFRRCASEARLDPVAPPMPTRPERHDARVSFVAALCRVVELAGANVRQATVDGSVDALVAALGHAREVGEVDLDIELRSEVFSVSGEPLRAGRAEYAAADGMAQVLVEQGASRLQFRTDVGRDAIVRLYEACTHSVSGQRNGLLEVAIPGIHIEAVDRDRSGTKESRATGVGLEGYAAALVALRGFYAGVAEHAPAELRWVRRIAHRLVDAVLAADPMPRSALALAHTHRDPAARALHTALLALVSAQQVTTDRATLSRVALAALLRNVVEMSADGSASASVPARIAALCLSVGGGCSEALAGVVAAFGAAWLEHDLSLGPMADLSPLLTSRLVHQIGRLVDTLSQEEPHQSPSEALRRLLELPDIDRECLCLLVAAVGALPIGTIVELDNGAWGVVIEPSLDPDFLDRPTVRLLTTNTGRAIDRPALTDLRRAGSGGPQRAVRLVPSRFTRFNIVQTLSLDG